jgi:serine protease AprX
MLRIMRVSLLIITFGAWAASAGADAWWVFFDDAPGRRPGDSVSAGAVERIAGAGASIRVVSRYFNAASVDWKGDPSALSSIPGVAGVRRVHAMSRTPLPGGEEAPFLSKPVVVLADTSGGYGVLGDELRMLGIPSIHNLGFTGAGVTVGVLETGFDRYGETPCLAGIKVLGRRNFVRGGEDVSGDTHGTMVLTCIAAGKYGDCRGAAPGASFLLAATDDPATETRADEDRWVAGVEWCDSLGADIISSSLVYNEFDTVAESYTKAQMDGRTSLVARAAEIAVSRGIIVVNSAGNEGALPWRIIDTPGDAEHVITVGAVNVTSGTPVIAAFSSRGPTADGRIKPDVVAPGAGVFLPVPGETAQYQTVSGTSFATPFISGLCALLLEAHPGLTPAMVMAALKGSARDLGDPGPDTDYGWGLPDGPAALNAVIASVEEDLAQGKAAPSPFTLLAPYPNPFNPSVRIPFRLSKTARLTVEAFAITGARVAVIGEGTYAPGAHEFLWDASGFAAGVYLVKASCDGFAIVRRVALVK